jgi:hypothetical protein
VANYIEEYNERRLHSAIGYVAPVDKLLGREEMIFTLRDEKLQEARRQRAAKRSLARTLDAASTDNTSSPDPAQGQRTL